MRISSIRLITVGVALGAGALLSACSSQNAGAPAGVSSANVAPQGFQRGSGPEDVNCSANGGGPVGPYSVDLIAVEGKAGRVGCTEAFNVITEYYDNADKAEGSGRFLTVKDWKCGADTGAQGSGVVACEKDGLSLHTTAPGSKKDLKFPGTTQTVQLTGYDSKLGMVEFRLTHWVAGGADNGHYEDVPGDNGVHRLPLAKTPKVLSAATLCPGGAPAIGSDGRGNKACSKEKLLAVLKDGQSVTAEIKVDGDDRIATVSELYTP